MAPCTYTWSKVIGAKYFNLQNAPEQNLSPADDDGHGTHTSSTAAGVVVRGASLDGIGVGTARGGVSRARIAMYKVCWSDGCSDMDLLAAFDEAIDDGVNVITVSLGGTPRKFFSDPTAIGSFHAMKRGILTSCSAGNNGPSTMTVENVAPWILTVAASNTDRQFTTAVHLADGKKARVFIFSSRDIWWVRWLIINKKDEISCSFLLTKINIFPKKYTSLFFFSFFSLFKVSLSIILF